MFFYQQYYLKPSYVIASLLVFRTAAETTEATSIKFAFCLWELLKRAVIGGAATRQFPLHRLAVIVRSAQNGS